ncbi:MAG: arginase [Bacteroidetes bacterium]|nr:arginase [Bacteroidota bacterium]MCY4232410.1 arginase [Bacteroidota bacterium]
MSHKLHHIHLIGVPMDLGQNLRGVDVGPSALRYAGIADRLRSLGHSVEDLGNIHTSHRDSLSSNANYVQPIRDTCALLYETVRQSLAKGAFPLIMGGDHSISIGSIGGTTHHGPKGVLWIDAHADCNTPESSPSGNIHGMPLAVLRGHGPDQLTDLGRLGPKLQSKDVVLIALRDLDLDERRVLNASKMGIYTMRDIDERGIADVTRSALAQLQHHHSLHVSFDVDSIDPHFAPGVGTPIEGGLQPREAHLIMELIAEDGRLSSAEIVEINPIIDKQNKTAELAVGLVESLMGKTIL